MRSSSTRSRWVSSPRDRLSSPLQSSVSPRQASVAAFSRPSSRSCRPSRRAPGRATFRSSPYRHRSPCIPRRRRSRGNRRHHRSRDPPRHRTPGDVATGRPRRRRALPPGAAKGRRLHSAVRRLRRADRHVARSTVAVGPSMRSRSDGGAAIRSHCLAHASQVRRSRRRVVRRSRARGLDPRRISRSGRRGGPARCSSRTPADRLVPR